MLAAVLRSKGSIGDIKIARWRIQKIHPFPPKRIKGILRGTEGDDVLVETAAGVKAFPFATIARARLVPAIDWKR